MLISALILLGVWFACLAVFPHVIEFGWGKLQLSLLIVILTVGPLECVTIRSLFRRIKRVDFEIEDVLSGHPHRGILSRALSYAWWMVHFIFAAVFAEWYIQAWHVNSETMFWGFDLQPMLICFLAAVGSNFFLLLALSALGISPQSLRLLWRFRFLIDLVVAFAATAISFPPQLLTFARHF